MFAAFARHLAETLPPELGMTDPRAVFAMLWGRLADMQAEAGPDAAPAEPPNTTSATPAHAASALPFTPADSAAEAPAAGLPPRAAIAASRGAPRTAVLPWPRWQRGRLCRMPLYCSWRNRGWSLPPPRRLYYAACAGPA